MIETLPPLPAFSRALLHRGGLNEMRSVFERSATAAFGPDEAQRFAALWPRLTRHPRGGMRCYDPAYEVSLENGGTELFTAEFCWRCRHIRFRHTGGAAAWFAWDSEQPEARALFDLFNATLPLPRRPKPPEVCPDPRCGHSWEGLPVGGICPGCKLTKTHEPIWRERP